MTKGYEVGKTYKVVAEYFATPDVRLNHVFTPTKLDSSGDAWVDCFCYSKDRFSTGSVVEWDVDNNRPMSETIKLNQENKMSNTNIKQMQDQLEQAQRHLAELQKQLEDAKKKEKEQNVFGIGKSEDNTYWFVSRCSKAGFTAGWGCATEAPDEYALTTQRQAERFAEAFKVIMELRSCEGVIVPDENWYWAVKYTEQGLLEYENLRYSRYGAVSPCFSTLELTEAAVQKVGEQRVINAIKTLTGLPE